MGEWQAIGGRWEIGDGVALSKSNERGAKLLAGSADWTDYTLTSDVRFDGAAADMGVVIRSNDETEGTDTYNGYFVGLRSLDGKIVVGRAELRGMDRGASGANSGRRFSCRVVPIASERPFDAISPPRFKIWILCKPPGSPFMSAFAFRADASDCDLSMPTECGATSAFGAPDGTIIWSFKGTQVR